MIIKKKRYLAFTLAEVLITLLIIGVVSSIVIPAIIQNSQDAELKTALRGFYASISDATKLIMLDNGGTVKGLFTNSIVMRDLYAEKMNVVGKCNSSVAPGNCWHMDVDGTVKYFVGSDVPGSASLVNSMKLNNGVFLSFNLIYSNCNGQYSGLIAPVSCALIRADINGFKGPNRFGKDIFDFHVLTSSVSPRGGSYDDDHSCSGTGSYCAGYILANP